MVKELSTALHAINNFNLLMNIINMLLRFVAWGRYRTIISLHGAITEMFIY